MMSLQNTDNHGKIFPKLFIGDASVSFKRYLKLHGYKYTINIVTNYDELVELIEKFSRYKNYELPVIIDDVSFLNERGQSMLLKFMDDTDLNLILLASRDNILGTIISRAKEIRKFYVATPGNRSGYIQIGKAREMFNNDHKLNINDNYDSSMSIDDTLKEYSKYNPLLSYNDMLVSKYRQNDRAKLLSIIES